MNTPQNKSQVTIQTTISAKLNKVWDYYNSPQHITQWNAASPDWHCPKATNDLRVGGKFTSRMEARDGSFGFDFEGVYQDVQDQKKIAYTMADGRKVSTNFESMGDQTKITTIFDAETENPVEMQKQGWQSILNNFKSYTEAN